jgi:uncharacterized protein YegL
MSLRHHQNQEALGMPNFELETVEFAENPEPRCACVLLLDTSGSMSGEPISALNEGLQVFKNDLQQDTLASKRVEVGIITFDSDVTTIQDFVTVDRFDPPHLTAQGQTAMGSGILRAIEMVQERKQVYKRNGIVYFRPWIFMITDGEPTEPDHIVDEAAKRIREEEERQGVAFFAVGVEGANMKKLEEIAVRKPVKLKGLKFKELFEWLSASMQNVSRSRAGDQVPLPPAGWAEI